MVARERTEGIYDCPDCACVATLAAGWAPVPVSQIINFGTPEIWYPHTKYPRNSGIPLVNLVPPHLLEYKVSPCQIS